MDFGRTASPGGRNYAFQGAHMSSNPNSNRRTHSQSRMHAWLALVPLQRFCCAYLIGATCRWPVWLIKHAVCKGNCRTSCPPRSLSSSSKPKGIAKQPQLRTACKPSFVPTALLCKPSAACHGNPNTAELQAQIRASAQLCTYCCSFCAHLTRMTMELHKSVNHIDQYQQLLCSKKAMIFNTGWAKPRVIR